MIFFIIYYDFFKGWNQNLSRRTFEPVWIVQGVNIPSIVVRGGKSDFCENWGGKLDFFQQRMLTGLCRWPAPTAWCWRGCWIAWSWTASSSWTISPHWPARAFLDQAGRPHLGCTSWAGSLAARNSYLSSRLYIVPNLLLSMSQNISISTFGQSQICSALTITILINELFWI